MTFDGGESSQAAKERIVGVVHDVFCSVVASTILVTHGNLLALLF